MTEVIEDDHVMIIDMMLFGCFIMLFGKASADLSVDLLAVRPVWLGYTLR